MSSVFAVTGRLPASVTLPLATRPASVSGPCAAISALATLTRRFSRACAGFGGEGAEAQREPPRGRKAF